MASNVNTAFSEFLNSIVNVKKEESDKAKKSRDFLLEQIQSVSANGVFLSLAPQYNSFFGSFARKTKIQPLDDIDIIIGLSGDFLQMEGYEWNNITLKVKNDCSDRRIIDSSDKFTQYWGLPIYQLNSNIVKNKLVSALKNIPQYEKSEIHARGEAVTLKLKSYSWNFDIVPAFYCSGNGVPYYLIPNGYGKWKKTNPKTEQDRLSKLNAKFNGIVLSTIRLVKYWNRRGQMPNIISYVLETMVLDYFTQTNNSVYSNGKCYDYPDMHFRDALLYIANNIMCSVQDSKGIQGNINTLTYEQRLKIKTRANNDYYKSCNAVNAEIHEKNNHKSNYELARINGFINEIDNDLNTMNEFDLKNRINVLQVMIYGFRQTKYLIPDWFENIYHKRRQAIETRKARNHIVADKKRNDKT